MTHSKKVIIGLSGGVDSSVAAYLLKKEGYIVEALFMKNWEEDDSSEYCHASKDLEDARAVCALLHIKLHTANFSAEYWDEVFENFLQEYKAGRTPNPDILCNREIKFKAFLDYAITLGADYIATGHYARIQYQDNYPLLLKGVDSNKDQSYFLYAINEYALSKSLFPIGGLSKPEVRHIAHTLGFANHKKKDSTGICFIGERRFKDFLSQYLKPNPGYIETLEGKIIGQHEGLMYYTLGQRQGLKIGGLKDTASQPWYVAAKDMNRNVLIAVQGYHHPLLYTTTIILKKIHWINRTAYKDYTLQNLSAKIRYRQSDAPCVLSTNTTKEEFIVTFKEPQRAATPGQSIVFYNEAHCLGGGIIDSFIPQTLSKP